MPEPSFRHGSSRTRVLSNRTGSPQTWISRLPRWVLASLEIICVKRPAGILLLPR